MIDCKQYAAALAGAAAFLQRECGEAPAVAVIAGTGLGSLCDGMDSVHDLDYADIPGFPVSTVATHNGRLLVGDLGGRRTLVFQGRFHLYEGYHPWEVVFPFRAAFAWGVHGLIVSNAAGGLDLTFRPGDIMLITDHINALGDSPLAGPHLEQWGDRFPDMSRAYDPELRKLAVREAESLGVDLHAGIYVAVKGPNLETPAETRFYRRMGADAIGMSTVLEVIAARQAGVKVLGFSVISNVNDPDDMAAADLDDIVAAASRGAAPLAHVIQGVRAHWPES